MTSWRWMLRPKWFLAFGLATILLLFFLWPVRVYSRLPSLGEVMAMNHFGETESGVRGLVSLRYTSHSNPAVRRLALEKIDRFDRDPVAGLGDEAFVSLPPYRKNQPGMPVTFRRYNVIVRIVPDLPRREMSPEELGRWRVAVEEFARKVDREIVSGRKAGRYVLRPRAVYWYGDRIAGLWRKARIRLGI